MDEQEEGEELLKRWEASAGRVDEREREELRKLLQDYQEHERIRRELAQQPPEKTPRWAWVLQTGALAVGALVFPIAVLGGFATIVSLIANLLPKFIGASLGTPTGTATIVALATMLYTMMTALLVLEARWTREAQQRADVEAKAGAADVARIADALARMAQGYPPLAPPPPSSSPPATSPPPTTSPPPPSA